MENKILFINLLNSNTIHVYDLNNVQNVISDTHNLGCRTIYSPINRNYNTLSTMYCNIGTRQGNKNYISFKIKMQKMIIVIRQSLNYIFFLHQRKKKVYSHVYTSQWPAKSFWRSNFVLYIKMYGRKWFEENFRFNLFKLVRETTRT